MLIPSDNPLYADQWHFALLGDIEAIWLDYTGDGVSVAVYDDGMDIDHVDLVGNYDASLHFSGDDGLNNSGADGHGTAVGGLIAGANNGIGGVGVAFGASLTSVDFLNDAFLNNNSFDAINHMSSFDIINQSYGYDATFEFGQSLAENTSFTYLEQLSLAAAAMAGRDGLGTIMVKAAGNAANDPNLRSIGINGNAQGEGGNNVHFVVVVGALGDDGSVADYSSYGANLLVSAGAGSVTTDLTGAAGYDPTNFTNTFGGTSAATPVTAGVIALMLEANPDLTVVDVQMILALSSAMTGSALGENAQGFEVGEWISVGDGSGTWNGGDLTYNPSYGYGAVDAFAAVRMAEIWAELADNRRLTDQTLLEFEETTNYVIADNQTFDIVFTVSEGMMIDHLYITLDLYHTYASDLEIQLITPDGDVFDLAMGDGSSNTIDHSWTFGVAALRGTDSEGDWIIRIADDAGGDTGTVFNAELQFVGYDRDYLENEVWHFTDDFLALAAVEGGRTTIDDGRIDNEIYGVGILNMVAVSGDVTATLDVGGSIRVDNVFWADIATDEIRRFFSGDGDDRITGGALSEGIDAGRGDDLVFGAAGADYMEGGRGNDVMFGEMNGGYGTDASAEIFRLFNSVFGREPAQAGHQNWMNQLLTDSMTLDDVAELFIAGAEFQNTYGSTTNTEFVSLLFQNVLGRPPADAGLNAWVNNISNGMSRAEVVRRISEAAENVNRTADDLGSFENDNDATVFAPRIYRLFEAVFGREPNPDGFKSWVSNFENGMSFEEAVGNFMGTPEFSNLYAGTTNEEFMQTLFQNVLGRPPADSGLAAWTANLDNGMARQTVVEIFVDGAEFVNRTADDLYDFMTFISGSGGSTSADYISAGDGQNIVAGGLYVDTFIFNADESSFTTVLDFEAWDVIRFSDFGFGSVEVALAEFGQVGDDVTFDALGTGIIFLDTDLDDILASNIFLQEIV